MQFGKVINLSGINFNLPADHLDTKKILREGDSKAVSIYIGCAKWNKQDLKGFYPRGIKDELCYYSRQFNSIELNATFYRIFSEDQFIKWYNKTPEGFKFFPKIVQNVSHINRLSKDADAFLDLYLANVIHLKDKLGTIFIQLHENFGPKNFERVQRFVQRWLKELSLAIEFRHTDWFNNDDVAEELYDLLETNNISNIITDTAGRRDLLHMRLTNKEAFIRYVGANHTTDYSRLDDWAKRIKHWNDQGIEKIHFFIHQNIEKESPLLSKHFIAKLNNQLGLTIKLPKSSTNNLTLFD